MRLKLFVVSWLCLCLGACVHTKQSAVSHLVQSETGGVKPGSIKTESLEFFDQARNRKVPVLLYVASDDKKAAGTRRKVAILNHGYGGNNNAYSFIAHFLVSQGYAVASIQHELPNDEPMPITGNVYQVRMPFWQRGVQNIRFTLKELQQLYPKFDFSQLLLVGHSNGGDMAMLFAQQNPTQVERVISLDNRRVPLPRVSKPKILTLRSSDQPADSGVLPTPEEQKRLGITVIQLGNTIHNDIWDGATQQQKQEMLQYIATFLQRK